MIALKTRFTALTALGTSQLFEIAVKLLDVPAHGILVLNGVKGQRDFWRVGNPPSQCRRLWQLA